MDYYIYGSLETEQKIRLNFIVNKSSLVAHSADLNIKPRISSKYG